MRHDRDIAAMMPRGDFSDGGTHASLSIHRALPSTHAHLGFCEEGIGQLLELRRGRKPVELRSFSPRAWQTRTPRPRAAARIPAASIALVSELAQTARTSLTIGRDANCRMRATPAALRCHFVTGFAGSTTTSGWEMKNSVGTRLRDSASLVRCRQAAIGRASW